MTGTSPLSFIVMGPAGSGKTTVGQVLARLTGLQFLDADDFHDPSAIAKMSRGTPLTEEDRAPWLARLALELDTTARGLVLGCSALRANYRQTLGTDRPGRRLVYLHVPEQELVRRLQERTGHFAGSGLLASQLALLEIPSEEETYDGTATPEEIAWEVLRRGRIYP